MFRVFTLNKNPDVPRDYSRIATALFLAALCYVLRIFVTESYFVDADTVSVALGVKSYSLAGTRPHLPGYFLHVKIISLLSYFTGDAHSAMLGLAIFYSAAAALFTYLLLIKWFEKENAFWITLLLITNPMILYYGSSTEIYAFDWFFGAVLVYLSYNSFGIYLLPSLLAAGAGIRQSSGVFLLPLYFLLIYNLVKQEKNGLIKILLSHIPAAIIVYAWFVPMISSAGGLSEYLKLYSTNSPIPQISFLQNLYQMSSYLVFVLVPAVIFILFRLIGTEKQVKTNQPAGKKIIILLLLWIVPAMLTFIFVNYSKGYFLLIAVPFYSLIFLLSRKIRNIRYAFVSAVLIQLAVYFLLPYKAAPADTMLNHSSRRSGLLETWAARTQSAYLMAASSIKYNNNSMGDLISSIDLIFYEDSVKSKSVFLDPTAAYFAKGLQYEFPDIKFFTMNQRIDDGYIEFKGLDIERKSGFEDELKNCILITRNDFLRNYLPEKFTVLDGGQNYSVISGDLTGLAEFYKKLFLVNGK